ncbi:MAG: hypothetical protein Q9163_000219 [Psora crenata]
MSATASSLNIPPPLSPGHDTIQPLLSACESGDLPKLESLLSRPDQVDLALSSRQVHYGLTRATLPTTRLMLEASCRAGKPTTAAYILDFAGQNHVAIDTLITRDAGLAAIDSAAPIELFTEFLRVMPTAVNLSMSHLGDPLSYALQKDKEKLAEYLLVNGANPNAPCAAHTGPGHHLQVAAKRSSLQMTKALLSHGAQVAQSGALHMAAEKGRVDVIEALVAHGGDVNETLDIHVGFLGRPSSDNAKRRATETPLDVAVDHGQEEAAEWLRNHGAFGNRKRD